MKKKLIFLLVIVLILALIYLIFQTKIGSLFTTKEHAILNPQNATYTIDNEAVTLINGTSEIDIPDSSSKKITIYLGNYEIKGDFNGDGIEDSAFLLTQNSGGSGTFFYIAAVLSTKDGYKGTNAIFFGDRISPKTLEFKNGEIIVNYLDRRIDQPMVSFPSIPTTKYFKINGDALTEV
jgi:hypothetical protein